MRRSVFASFRKLVGRNHCPSSAKNGVSFSRSRFSLPLGLLLSRSGNENDSDELPACQRLRRSLVPCGEASGPQPSSASQAPAGNKEGRRKRKKAHLILIGLRMPKKVVSLSRFRRSNIRTKRPIFLMGYLINCVCRLERGGFFLSVVNQCFPLFSWANGGQMTLF